MTRSEFDEEIKDIHFFLNKMYKAKTPEIEMLWNNYKDVEFEDFKQEKLTSIIRYFAKK